MNATNFPLHLMPQSEVDVEMAAYFQERKDEAAAGRASAIGNRHKPAPAKSESSVELSPEMRRVKEKMQLFLRGTRASVPLAPAISHVEKESYESSKTPVKPPEVATITSFPVTVMKTPAPAEIISGSQEPAVGKLAKRPIFPVRGILAVKEFDDPLREMSELCRQFPKHNDYARVREDYCNISIRLNLICKLAPAYRPLLQAEAACNNVMHKMIHRDQVVIDLHWCHATKMPLMPMDQEYVVLIDKEAEFPFDRAWTLAGEQWQREDRAVMALCLTTFQQCQMLLLHGPEVATRLKVFGAGRRKSGGTSVSKIATVKRLISQWAEQDKRILSQRDHYEKLWIARETLGHEASNQQIAELHALAVGGQIQDRTTIRDKLKSLDRHVPVV